MCVNKELYTKRHSAYRQYQQRLKLGKFHLTYAAKLDSWVILEPMLLIFWYSNFVKRNLFPALWIFP